MKSLYRYQRKFVITSFEYEYIINKIEVDGWNRLFPKRRINNIYLDSPSKKSYQQCIDGDFRKEKYRIRWYGSTFPKNKIINEPIFQIKKKIGNVNYKLSKYCKDIELYDGMAYSNLKNQIFGQLSSVLTKDESIKIFNKDFEFINNYDREYYTDKTSTIRLTIDKNQNYFQVTPNIKYYATNSLGYYWPRKYST